MKKSKKYTAVVFDLDGTILNTLYDLAAAVNYTMSEMNCPLRRVEEVRVFVGNGVGKLLERALPFEKREQETVAAAYGLFCKFYAAHCADRTAPYPGVKELLIALKSRDCRLAVVTNKADFAAKALCEKFYPDIFDCVIGAREDLPRKPAPEGVWLALKELDVAAADSLFVGDSDVDYYTAKNAGTDGVLVSWGFRERASLSDLPGAVVCDSIGELKEILL